MTVPPESGARPQAITERFELRRRLGAGGMGVVYEAFDPERNSIVALKVMKQADPQALYRFKREFRALADIRHRNLVALYELMSFGESWCFTMELIEGTHFLDHVRGLTDPDDESYRNVSAFESDTASVPGPTMPQGTQSTVGISSPAVPAGRGIRLDEGRLRPALRQLAEGVYGLHRAGRLHRDIKPSNVLVDQNGRVVLCDFGLVQELVPHQTQETAAGFAGTISHMSPEQAGGKPVAEASDWYSVGVILYQSLTGRLPFAGAAQDVLTRKRTRAARSPRTIAPDSPPDLCALCEDLLQRKPEARPTGKDVLARLGAKPAPEVRAPPTAPREVPFVGREDELSALQGALDDSHRDQRAVTVFVHGRSGMGKSEIVQQFVSRARADKDVLVLAGRCYERESVPFKAFDSIIDALTKHMVRLPPARCDELCTSDIVALSRLFPVLRQVPAIAELTSLGFDVPDPRELRRRAFDALRETLRRISREQRVVLVIDDLQWGDMDSGRLLRELLRAPDAPPLLLVAAYRIEELATSRLLQSLRPRARRRRSPLGDVREVSIDALESGEARDLALLLLGGDESEKSRAEAVARESGGSPFFVGELVDYVRTGAALEDVKLENLLGKRIGRLPAAARRLLEVIAVAGRPVDLAVVATAAGTEENTREALALLRNDCMVRTMGMRAADRTEAYHDRIREAVVAGLEPDTLRATHERLALAYEQRGSADPEALLEHWRGAERLQKAGTHAATAAAQAAATLAFDRAVDLFQVALELGTFAAEEGRLLRVALGDALVNAGHGADAAEVYLSAVEGAHAAEALELRRRAAEQWLQTGHFNLGLKALREVLSSVRMKMAATPKRALLSLVIRRVQVRLRGLGFEERDPSQVSAEDLTRIDILRSASSGLSMIDAIRGMDFQTRHLLAALKVGEPNRVARGLALEAALVSAAGASARPRTLRLLSEAKELSKRVDDPYPAGLIAVVEGVSTFLRGEWKAAKRCSIEAKKILLEHCTGVGWELGTAHFFSFGAMCYLGELVALTKTVPEVLRQAEDHGDLWLATGIRSWRTNAAWLAADDPDGARRQVETARQQWTRGGFHLQHYYELLADCQIELYKGAHEEAWKRVKERWKPLSRSMLLRVQNVRIEAHHLRARCALAMTEKSDDKRFLTSASKDARRIAKEKLPWANGLSRLVVAAVSSRRGDDEAAVEHLRIAAEHFTSADMPLHSALCRYRGGEASALDEVAEMGAQNPARFAAMLSPGFRQSGS